MTPTRPGVFWVLLLLGTAQAALAASILSDWAWVWWCVGAAYPVWLTIVVRRPSRRTTGGLLLLGYAGPVLLFGAVYAGRVLPFRPETTQAQLLLRTDRHGTASVGSDVPTPKLAPTCADRELARAVWLLLSTFLYLAACAVAGLLAHTPLVVYLGAVLVGVFCVRHSEG